MRSKTYSYHTIPASDHKSAVPPRLTAKEDVGPAAVSCLVLGHAEIGVTMNTYAHVLPALRQEAADAMDELFGA